MKKQTFQHAELSEGTVCVASFIHEGLTETSVYFSPFPMMLLDVTGL